MVPFSFLGLNYDFSILASYLLYFSLSYFSLSYFSLSYARRRDSLWPCNITIDAWKREAGIEQGTFFQNQGMVLTYGSCKLEAADREADMDLICIAPHVRL